MEIILAFAVMLPIALVACILLSVLIHFFSVEKDPKLQQICDCLPGANCGACGYKGCEDYANAVASGKAQTNLCVPGSQQVTDQLSEIMGVNAGSVESNVAFVACNGNCEATSKKADYVGVESCRGASMLFGGDSSCSFGCLGLGDCAKACPSDAICLYDGIAHVNPDKCFGCGKCVNTCPKNIITLIPANASTVVMCSNKQKGADARKACKNACIGCMKCMKTCTKGAITVKNNLASVDYSKCDRCGECVEVCVTSCLKSIFTTSSKVSE